MLKLKKFNHFNTNIQNFKFSTVYNPNFNNHCDESKKEQFHSKDINSMLNNTDLKIKIKEIYKKNFNNYENRISKEHLDSFLKNNDYEIINFFDKNKVFRLKKTILNEIISIFLFPQRNEIEYEINEKVENKCKIKNIYYRFKIYHLLHCYN